MQVSNKSPVLRDPAMSSVVKKPAKPADPSTWEMSSERSLFWATVVSAVAIAALAAHQYLF